MKVSSIIVTLLALGALASCNTIRGAGEDVQAGGAAVENAATDAQGEMQSDQADKDDKPGTPQR
jgi:predicted small secreted protein